MLSEEEKSDSPAVGKLVDKGGEKKCETDKVCATLIPGKDIKVYHMTHNLMDAMLIVCMHYFSNVLHYPRKVTRACDQSRIYCRWRPLQYIYKHET